MIEQLKKLLKAGYRCYICASSAINLSQEPNKFHYYYYYYYYYLLLIYLRADSTVH